MAEFGLIHEKLDIKIFILYILRKLPENVPLQTLVDLRLTDEGIGYFDFIECLDELIETEHISEEDNYYSITEKGIRNGEAIESSLPYTVRKAADTTTDKISAKMHRDGMILASHHPNPTGGLNVELSLSDGIGEIISMRLLASSPEQAQLIKRNFRKNAESYYGSIIELLSTPE